MAHRFSTDVDYKVSIEGAPVSSDGSSNGYDSENEHEVQKIKLTKKSLRDHNKLSINKDDDDFWDMAGSPEHSVMTLSPHNGTDSPSTLRDTEILLETVSNLSFMETSSQPRASIGTVSSDDFAAVPSPRYLKNHRGSSIESVNGTTAANDTYSDSNHLTVQEPVPSCLKPESPEMIPSHPMGYFFMESPNMAPVTVDISRLTLTSPARSDTYSSYGT